MHDYIMQGDISDVAICTSLHAVMKTNSQRDDPRGEALGDGFGVHAEGTVFGAGAGRRAAGDLRGSPGVRFPRQAEEEEEEAQKEDQPRPSRSKLKQHRPPCS